MPRRSCWRATPAWADAGLSRVSGPGSHPGAGRRALRRLPAPGPARCPGGGPGASSSVVYGSPPMHAGRGARRVDRGDGLGEAVELERVEVRLEPADRGEGGGLHEARPRPRAAAAARGRRPSVAGGWPSGPGRRRPDPGGSGRTRAPVRRRTGWSHVVRPGRARCRGRRRGVHPISPTDSSMSTNPANPVTSTRSGVIPTRSVTACATTPVPPSARAALMRSKPGSGPRAGPTSRGGCRCSRPCRVRELRPTSWIASVRPSVTGVPGRASDPRTRTQSTPSPQSTALADPTEVRLIAAGCTEEAGMTRATAASSGTPPGETGEADPGHGDTSVATVAPSSSATS